MPNVTVVKPFTFQHEDGYKELIPAGTYDMDEDMAKHPYVLAHTDKPPPVRALAGSHVFEEQMNAFKAAEQMRQDQEDQVAQQAADEARLAFREAATKTKSPRPPNERPRLDDAAEPAA